MISFLFVVFLFLSDTNWVVPSFDYLLFCSFCLVEKASPQSFLTSSLSTGHLEQMA